MPIQEDPVVARRFLCGSLRTAREARGLTQLQAAKHLEWSHSKLVRIENGVVGLSVTDLRALLRLYEVSDGDTIAKLEQAARIAKQPAWYRKYSTVVDAGFEAYLGYESAASMIMVFQTLTIPGLLQTGDYARAILEADNASHAEERLELRMERQSLLMQPNGPILQCVVDEAALRRQVGGASVMYDQLISLKEATKRSALSIEIVPFSAGAHASMVGSFTVLHSEHWDEDVLFREGTLQTVTDRQDHDLIAGYKVRFDLLRGMSLGEEQSGLLLDAIITELRNTAHAEPSQ
jgi:transcriptional regulator with XRE-family HTH domain